MILSKLRKHVLADIEAGNAIELISSSGRGKSEWTWQLFEHLCEVWPDMTLGYTDLFLATQTPPDLIGYQFKGEATFGGRAYTRSEASLPLWMQTKFVRMAGEGKKIQKLSIPAWGVDRMFIFLDEYGQGEVDVKRSSAQLFLKGEIGPWQAPEGSIRIAASNEGARYGVTKDLDFVINRKSTYRITDDVDTWLLWADKPYLHEGKTWTVQPFMKAFAKTNQHILFEPEPKQQGPWCTPRSFCATDRYLQIMERVNGKIDPDDFELKAGMTAKIGDPAASALQGFLTYRLAMPQFEEVIADPEKCPLPDKPDKMMIMAYELAARSRPEHLERALTYMKRRGMPQDLGVTFVTSLVRRDKMMMKEKPVREWLTKNATMLAFLQSHE